MITRSQLFSSRLPDIAFSAIRIEQYVDAINEHFFNPSSTPRRPTPAFGAKKGAYAPTSCIAFIVLVIPRI